MIDTLDHYCHRSLEHITDTFTTHPTLAEKVAPSGALLPFWGNTVVFTLSDADKERVAQLQHELYRAAGFLLAEPLSADTFHMTLHDLVNGAGPLPPEGSAPYSALLAAEEAVRPMLASWHRRAPLRMRGSWMFNMNQTSLVLGLKPDDHETYLKLCGMYAALQQVVPLKHKLCPHITLAYYKPASCTAKQIDALKTALRPAPLVFELDCSRLHLQRFTDMNHYTTLL